MTYYWLGSILIFLTAVISLEWVVAYHRLTGGAWRDSAAGRHMMAFMGSITAVLLAWSGGVFFRLFDEPLPTWYVVGRLIVFVSVPIVLLQRRGLLSRAQKRGTNNAASQTPDD